MAFQAHVQQDGQWIPHTVDLQTLVSANTPAQSQECRQPPPASTAADTNTPAYGLLVRTVVESPVAHWVLPAQLRSSRNNDIAFIGDHFVQISEFCNDEEELHDIARQCGFGSRICNARVLDFGAHPNLQLCQDGPSPLPPQMLALALECGDFVFLFMRDHDASFIQSRFSPQNPAHVSQAFHFAVEPRSRYMATAISEGLFVLYELQPYDLMCEHYSNHGLVRPVRACRARSVQGVILKMDFLHPRPGDTDHIILLLIIVRNNRTRMVVYEWRTDEGLEHTFAEAKKGHRLPNEHKMPILVAPLTVRNAFMVVSQHAITVFKDPLQGPPIAEDVPLGEQPATEFHHGLGPPMWAGWSRPFRRYAFHEREDIIYLGREDGTLVYFELQSETGEVVKSNSPLGNIGSSLSGAFGFARDPCHDILIAGGDSSPGSVWRIVPRSLKRRLEILDNWVPVVDMAITDDPPTSWNSFRPPKKMSRYTQHRVFGTSGRGRKAAITEYRMGIRAAIGLDVDFGESAQKCWVLTSPLYSHGVDGGLHVLVGLPDSSVLLHLSADLSEATAPDANISPFDHSSRTLAVIQRNDGVVIQATETMIVTIGPSGSTSYSLEQTLGLDAGYVELVSFHDNLIAIVRHSELDGCQICFARIDDGTLAHIKTLRSEAGITCLSWCRISGRDCLVAGQQHAGIPILTVYEHQNADLIEKATIRLGPVADDTGDDAVESLTSIVVLDETPTSALLVMGSRSGHIITLELSGEAQVTTNRYVEQLAAMPVEVSSLRSLGGFGISVLACCDSQLILLSNWGHGGLPRFQGKQRIIPVDSNNSALPTPPINSACCLERSLTGKTGSISLLMLAGTRILLTDMYPRLEMVPRHIPTNGTPTKLVYSARLGCFIVAVQQQDRPTLLFIDPDTGQDISAPVDARTREPVDFIPGLGGAGDRVYGLHEWFYPKDGKYFHWLIVTTRHGRLLVLSAKADSHGPLRRISYWTRCREKRLGNPLYSVAADGEGVIFCVGSVLYWKTLDMTEKRLKLVGKYPLDSPATSLRIDSRGTIYALTTDHSLVLLRRTIREASMGHVPSDDIMSTIYTDQVSRKATHLAAIGDLGPESSSSWPVILVGDRYCGVVGLSLPRRQTASELEVVFTGELGSSIRRFRQGRTRPLWSRFGDKNDFGRIKSTVDDAETLGVALDGTLRHFTLLRPELWRLLAFIQEATLPNQFGAIPPLYTQDQSGNDSGHMKFAIINGDILYQVYIKQNLGCLLELRGRSTLFYSLLDQLEGGILTSEFRETGDHSKYLQLAYKMLGRLLTYAI